MTLYGFRDRGTAENLKYIGETMNFQRNPGVTRKTGREVRIAKVSETIDAVANEEWSSGAAVIIERKQDGTKEETTNNITLFNTTEEDLVADQEVTVIRQGEKWITLPGGASTPAEAPKRVKFKLNDPLWTIVAGSSGSVTATVVDPMNSGLTIGDQVQVTDYQKQFEFTQRNSVGIAYQANPFSAGTQWHIETCTQLVTRMEINLGGDLAPWDGVGGVPASTIVRSMSAYPDVLWATNNVDEGGETITTVSEGIGANVDQLRNPLGFAAKAGTAVVERRPIQAQIQDEDNQTLPYTVAAQAWYWAIVSVQNEISDWARTTYNGTDWELQVIANFDHAGGLSPVEMVRFANGRISNPPQKMWNAFKTAQRACHIAANEEGWAFLDKSRGEFVTMMSSSSLYGLGEVLDVVANFESENSQLIDNGSECGTIKYKTLTNVVVFGTDSSLSSCQMKLDPQPDLEVDVFNGGTQDVLTSIEIDEDGNLKMNTETIKACSTGSGSTVLPLPEMDVVNNVYCSGDSLVKDYKTIKFLGKEIAGNTAVQIDTSCIDIDYTQIVNYPTVPYIDYYDIFWPVGCDPCGDPVVGCCTGGTYDGTDVTESECLNAGGTSWSSTPCGGGGSCDGDTVTTFEIGGFGATGCSATFSMIGTATLSGGSATISGEWSGLAMSFPVSNVAGTFTLTHDGTNYSATGTLPSNWGGGTVTFSGTGSCTGTWSGSATLTGGNSPCGGMTNGTHDLVIT